MKPEKKILEGGVVVRSNCECNLCRVAFGKEPLDKAQLYRIRLARKRPTRRSA